MPSVDRLKQTLSFLDRMYQEHLTSEDPEEAVAFAKLAVLEFCGWVEMTIDDVARSAVSASLPKPADRKPLEKLIRKTSGFDYEHNITPLLVYSLGSVRFSKVERTLKTEGLMDLLKNVLNEDSFLSLRNRAAHTFIDGTPRNFDAPSAILGRLKQVEPLLERMRELCQAESLDLASS